jgi:aminoglycoside 3-N-acetyltransferase
MTLTESRFPIPDPPSMHSRSSLAANFRELGALPGDTIMLHASVRAVGEVAGGPDQIHLALEDVLTEDGTLIMYASCPQYVDEVGRGNLTPEQEAEVLEKLPAFDARTARSARENGALVELFRTYPGARVNEHPVRFVAWGSRADYLVAEQPWDFAFGRGSALERFMHLDGRILHLGSDHDTTTFLHHVEHVVDFPNKRVATFKVPVLVNGARVWRDMSEVDSADGGAHANWPDRFFATLTDEYLTTTHNTGGTVGNAPAFLFSARGLFAHAAKRMMETATRTISPAHGVPRQPGVPRL